MSGFHRWFYGVAAVTVAALFVLSYLNVSVLRSAEGLDAALDGYLWINSVLTVFIPVVFIALMILANVGFFRHDVSHFFLVALAVYVVFTGADYWFINAQFIEFQKAGGLWKGGMSFSGVVGIFFCLLASILTLLNYAAVRTIRKYTRLPAPPVKSERGS